MDGDIARGPGRYPVGQSAVDLILERHTLDVSLHLERRDGDIEVVMIK